MRIAAVLVLVALAVVGGCSSDEGHSMGTGPTAPSELTAAPLTGGAHLTWKDNSSNEDNFMVLRKQMGVDADFLVDTEVERHRQAYHVLLAQADVSEAGPQLARAIVDAQRERHYPGWPQALQCVRARYEQERATPDWKQAGLAEDPPAPIPTPHALQLEALEALEATRVDGFMTASDKPGLGITPKLDVLGDPVQVIR